MGEFVFEKVTLGYVISPNFFDLPLPIFIVAPCILIFTQFIHQQMHIY